MKIATWNIQSCARGLEAVAAVLRALDADVVALQEVDRGTLRAGRLDQAARLASAAGLAHFRFFRAVGWGCGDYGLALLSRWPLTGERVGLLPNEEGLEPRIHASAVVEAGGARLSIHLTHLTHLDTVRGLRLAQARRILDRLEADPWPKVLLGDFNALPGGSTHRAVRRRLRDAFHAAGEGPSGTYPLPWPLPAVRIDYLFVSEGVGVARSRVHATEASDHRPLTAEVRLQAGGEGFRRFA
ncbi:MAG TPA: endonuclease/exonuclease/phosphatase family protein [Myxococcales bacterium]